MTYCAGWKYENTVYLLADTAVTSLSAPITTHSSLGELHDQVRGEFVEESLLKIIPIASGTAVAFAGDVRYAFKIISFLKSNYGNNNDLRTLIKSLTASFGPFDKTRNVELLLATSSANGETQLLHWDTVRGLDSNASDYYSIGSITPYHDAITVNVLSRFVKVNMQPE